MITRVIAVEYVRRMRGGSQAHLLRCSDGEYYVVKFQNNPQGARTLANELLGGVWRLEWAFRLPETAIVEVSEPLINIQRNVRFRSGANLSRALRDNVLVLVFLQGWAIR